MGFNTVTKLVVEAAPDYAGLALVDDIRAAHRHSTNPARGAIGYDRGDPSRSFEGPVPVAQNVAAAVAGAAIPQSAIPYGPGTIHDGAVPEPTLSPLQILQFNRMGR